MKKDDAKQTAIDRAKDVLTQYMQEQNMRKTPERYAILETVMKMKGHNSADKILTLMPDSFHVSRATVYSTLQLLVECGLVFNHQINGIVLYEKAFECEPHNHTICNGCGKMSDLIDDTVMQTAMKIKTPRFKKMRSSTYIYGICNVCQAKLARMKKKMEQERKANMTSEEIRFARINEELAKMAELLGKK